MKRRSLLAGTLSLGGSLFARPRVPSLRPSSKPKFGKLVKDPDGILNLPQGFSYRVFSKTGEVMNDGLTVPSACDGMAAFPGPNNTIQLVRNHELVPNDKRKNAYEDNPELSKQLRPESFYDYGDPALSIYGGTSTLTLDAKAEKLLDHHLSLAGTLQNCAGGRTPWNTWISCEEIFAGPFAMMTKKHGYSFEVDPQKPGLVQPKPLKMLGRFRHEGLAIDPSTGIVYLTEDKDDGLFYRFVPKRPGQLDEGTFQALVIQKQPSVNTSNHDSLRFKPFEPVEARWIEIDPDPEQDDLRLTGKKLGAATFCRGEGIDFGNDAIFFTCTAGGQNQQGQVWCYKPNQGEKGPSSSGSLELVCESPDSQVMSMCDNLCVAPFGDLIICEDGKTQHKKILGITAEGEIYTIAQHVANSTELAGCCWSPDGRIFFFNIYHPGMTIAVTGPWPHLNS